MENDDHLDLVFHALADRRRRMLLAELADGPKPVRALADALGLKMSATSKHLAALEAAGLVLKIRQGRETVCHMNFDVWRVVASYIAMHAKFWASRLSELETYLINQRPRAKDQRHNANVSLNWDYDRWNFNVSGLWRSGWPYTPMRYSSTDGEPYIDPADYNTERLNHYLRFDVRIMRKKKLSNGDHFQYYLEVYNILNSENECCTYFESDNDGNRIPQSDSWMPLLPSFGVRYTFH